MSIAAQIAAIEDRLPAELGELPAGGELISIIMPTRNRAGFIGNAVTSVLDQSYRDWELIIIDDGGTDDTQTVLAPYLSDPRIRYETRLPKGPPAARNAGMAQARGALIGHLDSDNRWTPRYLAAMAARFAQPQVQSAYAALLRDAEHTDAKYVAFHPFSREDLIAANFIDINIYMHRRSLFERLGGFDENLRRMADWDLILRYTEAAAAHQVPIIGAHYHTDAPERISTKESFPDAFRQIRAKSRRFTRTSRAPRVLYALPERNLRTEIEIETEIRGMLGVGVQIEIWAPAGCGALQDLVPAHAGRLRSAIAAAQPDILHIHGLDAALRCGETALPMTVRADDGTLTAARLACLAARPNIRNIYVCARQALEFAQFPGLRSYPPLFDTRRFTPAPGKAPRLVFAAASAKPGRDFTRFLQISKLLPSHLCVLALLESGAESCLAETRALRAQLQAPAYILANLAHARVADWMARAAIYLHPGAPEAGLPLAIAEAAATGCHIFPPNAACLREYVAEAGSGFDSAEDAASRIAATLQYDTKAWAQVATRATDRAWSQFSGDENFFILHEDWARLSPRP